VVELSFQKIDTRGNAIDEPVTVRYAPAELALAKGAQFAEVAIPGLELPLIQFVRGDATTLSMDLFFDSTEGGTGATALSVTDEVEKFHKLVSIKGKLHHPPLVRISWGANFPGVGFGEADQAGQTFTAVVLSVARRFTLFNPDGKPLRAIVSVSLKQFATIADQVTAINLQSADHTRLHVVQEGETLPLIAYDAYGDPRQWRVIADHNDLADVRRLVPGTSLQLPPLA
jgi:nucleoid-associated protein YgaU